MIDNYIVRRLKVRWNVRFNLKATVYRSLLQLTCISRKEGKIVRKKRERYEVLVDIGNASSEATTRQVTRQVTQHTDCREQYVL